MTHHDPRRDDELWYVAPRNRLARRDNVLNTNVGASLRPSVADPRFRSGHTTPRRPCVGPVAPRKSPRRREGWTLWSKPWILDRRRSETVAPSWLGRRPSGAGLRGPRRARLRGGVPLRNRVQPSRRRAQPVEVTAGAATWYRQTDHGPAEAGHYVNDHGPAESRTLRQRSRRTRWIRSDARS